MPESSAVRSRVRSTALLRATRTALHVVAALPLPAARLLGRGLGRLAGLARLREARTTERNLALCHPQRPPSQRARLARSSLAETGALAAEIGHVWLRAPAPLLDRIEAVDGLPHLQAAEAAGRGVLLLVPHLGNWELLNLWLADRGPFTALYEPARDPSLDAWIRTCRERSGARLVPTDAGGIRELLRGLRSGATVGLLPDQVPPRSGGVHVPFFGVPALTMTLVQRLLRRTGASAVVGMALRTPRGFRIAFVPPQPGIDAADPVVAAGALNASVEDCVRLAPAQYQWDYKRFKRPPPGHRDPYGGDR